ncbi:DUF1793 domain-containing protein [Cesiribacter sp. SM1]|uniref:glutaminase domain-containing protein n=1 Tax=Cesiribacter sp. SM1 TaxID=2861196 RepID=UPI00351D4163
MYITISKRGSLYSYVIDTPARVPTSDWYETESAAHAGFPASSVMGSYFFLML